MIRYTGQRTESGKNKVIRHEERILPNGKILHRQRPLDPRNDLINHSPDGFEWGYRGSGPAQLALALCADTIGDKLALLIYQRLKEKVVTLWEEDDWEVTQTGLICTIEFIAAEMDMKDRIKDYFIQIKRFNVKGTETGRISCRESNDGR
jgi:hypothetical protein